MDEHDKRKSRVRRVAVLNIGANAVLAAASLAVGLLTGSTVVLGEAANAFGDILAAMIVYVVVRLASARPDREHPFGHARIEPLGGLAVALGLGLLAWELAKSAVLHLWRGPEPLAMGWAALAVLALHVGVKVGLSAHLIRVGRETSSPSIVATGIDARNDVLVALAALAGVGGSLAGYHWLDPAAALIVAAYILYSGFQIGMENIHYLIGTAPDARTIREIERAARAVDGVIGVHDVKAHYVGPFVHVALHVSIGPGYSAKQAHDIGDQVTEAVEGLGAIDRAFVHVDPVGAA